MEWMLLPYRRYAEFSGRSRRMEFWMWALFCFLVGLAIDLVFGRPVYSYGATAFSFSSTLGTTGGMLHGLFNLVNFIPGLAVSVRRLHDIDRSGWWLLLWLVPILGWIVLLVFFCLDSNSGPNRFGADPKERGTVDVFR
ncbi:MAG: DUF805 domain-containing protein [Sphingomonadales bacterium]|nr:DUF805 domain-containing protein [Sphingomonadales bacterium]